MSDTTPNLSLPFLLGSQAQKFVTVNTAFERLDSLVQLSVDAIITEVPAGNVAEGTRYLVGEGATGLLAGHEDEIARYRDGDWEFIAPRAGWCVALVDQTKIMLFDGQVWSSLSASIGDDPLTVPTVRSGEVVIPADSVASVPVPDSCGVVLVHLYHEQFPKITHSALLVYDAASSLQLLAIFQGTGAEIHGTNALTGTSGSVGKTGFSVQPGEIQIENRNAGAPCCYRFLFLN